MTGEMHLLPREAAERLRVTVGTLANWRCEGCGPRFISFGRRTLYPVAELEAFERAHLRSAVSVPVVPDGEK